MHPMTIMAVARFGPRKPPTHIATLSRSRAARPSGVT